MEYVIFFFFAGGFYFFLRSFKEGYWGRNAEDVKYQMFNDDEVNHGR